MSKKRVITVNLGDCIVVTSHVSIDGYHRYQRLGVRDFAHRHAYRQFYGEIPKGLVVRHSCDNPACINPKHLLLGTPEENVRDRVIRKRSALGEKNGRCKLTTDQVLAIREMDMSCYAIAKIFNVNQTTVQDIKKRKIWKHV